MAFLELMLAEYHMTLEYAWRCLPVAAGFALIEAREERLTGSCMGFVSRAAITARQRERARLEATHRIIETPPPEAAPAAE